MGRCKRDTDPPVGAAPLLKMTLPLNTLYRFIETIKSPRAFGRTLDSCIIAPCLTEFKYFLQIPGVFTAFYRSAKNPADRTVSVHKDVFSYERLVATSVMEAAAFSLSMVDHGLDDSAIASISFMVARSTSPTPVK